MPSLHSRLDPIAPDDAELPLPAAFVLRLQPGRAAGRESHKLHIRARQVRCSEYMPDSSKVRVQLQAQVVGRRHPELGLHWIPMMVHCSVESRDLQL